MENLSVMKSEIVWIEEECHDNILPLKEENCDLEGEPSSSFDYAQSTEQGIQENMYISEEMQLAPVKCEEYWDSELLATGVSDVKEDGIIEDENTVTSSSEEPMKLPSSDPKTQSEEIVPQVCFTRIGETYYCIPCDIPFHRQSDYNSHITKTHKRISSYQCPKCEKKFRYQSKLLEHVVMHSDVKPYVCKCCDRQFTRSGDVKKHMLSRHKITVNGNLQRIDVDSYLPNANNTIIQHVDVTHLPLNQQITEIIAKKNEHICYQCSELFTSKEELTLHISSVHSGHTKNAYVCCKCHQSLSDPYDFLDHMDNHPSNWKYDCNKCKKIFYRRTTLIHHMQRHASQSTSIMAKLMPVRQILKGDYPCKICGKIFSWPSKLTEHMATHTKKALFTCLICKKAFSTKTGYVYHMARHMDTGMFSCPICQKKYCRDSDLTKHLRTHSKLYPFSCKVCRMPFECLTELEKHVLVHSPKSP